MNMIFDHDPGYASAVKEYFDHRIANLRKLHEISKPNNDRFHFEILLLACCYIDALASIFTDEKEIGKRFLEILILWGKTNSIEFSKVNLIFLEEQIRRPINKIAILPEKYFTWISNEIRKRDYSRGDNTVHDLVEGIMIEKLLAMSNEEETKKYTDILKERVRKSTYAGVLYENYRNQAVHEAQTRGHWSSSTEDKPFYTEISGIGTELSFPPLFLIQVVENILSRIYKKCEEIFYRSEFGEPTQ